MLHHERIILQGFILGISAKFYLSFTYNEAYKDQN
jgi:hypothetical protein